MQRTGRRHTPNLVIIDPLVGDDGLYGSSAAWASGRCRWTATTWQPLRGRNDLLYALLAVGVVAGVYLTLKPRDDPP
jgi:hypothetical protein